ncbi:MAG: 50S ribosomal protein L25 [Candidatus Izemoplasmataceae bacterium]
MKLQQRNEPLNTLRSNNKVPGIMYGRNIEATSVAVDYKEFMQHLHDYGKSMTFSVKLDGKTHQVYIKDVQVDPLNQRNVLHFDLIRVTATSTITADIPVYLDHKEKVESRGMIVQQLINAVETEYGVGKGIQAFHIDVSNLEQGDALYVKDIEVPEGMKILEGDEKMVVNVVMPTIEEEPSDEEDEEEVEVEVIKQKDEDEA